MSKHCGQGTRLLLMQTSPVKQDVPKHQPKKIWLEDIEFMRVKVAVEKDMLLGRPGCPTVTEQEHAQSAGKALSAMCCCLQGDGLHD